MPAVVQFPVRLDTQDSALMGEIARRIGRSRADVVRAALRHFYALGPGEWRQLAAELLAPPDDDLVGKLAGGKGGTK